MREKIEKVLEEIRQVLQRDGGNIELVDVSDAGVVKVRLLGACCGCQMSQMTMQNFVEERLKKEIPEISSVKAV